MKVTLLCSDEQHPVNPYLESWAESQELNHQVSIVRRKKDLPGGDFLFLVSCSELIEKSNREKYRFCLVLHASDLPNGRGWSPHIWELLGGADSITLSLLEAEDRIDSGMIWKKKKIPVGRGLLWNEVNDLLFTSEVELIDIAVNKFESIHPSPQPSDAEESYYAKRTPELSRIDPGKSLESEFNLIRLCDPDRFPAFFDLHGSRYKILLEKLSDI
jgi:methionyl-tRNA formyltransferase